MTTIFENRETGYWAQVGENGRLFEFAAYKGRGTHAAAVAWFNEQKRFQNPGLSLDACVNSAARLQLLVEQVAVDFPLIGSDYKFVIDEARQCLAVMFGSLIVSETDHGFNVELVVNWLTKERRTVCTALALEPTAALLRRSPDSRSFMDMDGRTLHLSDTNREILAVVCKMQ